MVCNPSTTSRIAQEHVLPVASGSLNLILQSISLFTISFNFNNFSIIPLSQKVCPSHKRTHLTKMVHLLRYLVLLSLSGFLSFLFSRTRMFCVLLTILLYIGPYFWVGVWRGHVIIFSSLSRGACSLCELRRLWCRLWWLLLCLTLPRSPAGVSWKGIDCGITVSVCRLSLRSIFIGRLL